jgi:CRISPR-associated protein (TIGR03986 family)
MPVDLASAPYNFVELSRHVCQPSDLDPALAGLPSHDEPVSGGLSGSLAFTLTSDTPVLVMWAESGAGQDRDKPAGKRVGADRQESIGPEIKRFGRTPENLHAIPGSSLRGMVRNVLEIATFGKMILADDSRTSVRDLAPTARLDYGSRMAFREGGAFASRTFAGWLRIDGGQVKLRPCAFARIDHDDLSKLSPGFRGQVVQDFKDRTRGIKTDETELSQARRVEGRFLSNCPGLEYELWVQTVADAHEHSKGNLLRYRRAATTRPDAERPPKSQPSKKMSSAEHKRGKLVFTGMPSDKKHMEFFFFDPDPSELPVPEEIWNLFLDVHERQEKVSPTWEWRRPALMRGCAIPVFYSTTDAGKLEQIGLAMMFKRAADRSIGQMIKQANPHHRSADLLDLPERLFGRLETKDAGGKSRDDGLRGRVSFGWATATGGWDEPVDRDVRVILGKPKPGFPAAYVRQIDLDSRDWKLLEGEKKGSDGRAQPVEKQYRSYQTWAHGSKETVRGWKRYPARPPQLDTEGNPEGEGVVRLRPLRPSGDGPIRFTGLIRYHNLHPVELGALVWALTWGGNGGLRHALGMGRSLGWGRSRFEIVLSDDQTQALAAFVAAMEAWAKRMQIAGGWQQSLQVRQLCAMADPQIGQAEPAKSILKQMVLSVTPARNDFQEVKKAGFVLADYPLMVGTGSVPVAGKLDQAKGGAKAEPKPLRPLVLPSQGGDGDAAKTGAGQPSSDRAVPLKVQGFGKGDRIGRKDKKGGLRHR